MADLEIVMKSYRPEELFDEDGKVKKYIKELIPYNPMGKNPNANGGILLKELKVPSIDNYAVNED